MHTEKTQGKAILAGFVIAGAFVVALALPIQAAAQTITPNDPYAPP